MEEWIIYCVAIVSLLLLLWFIWKFNGLCRDMKRLADSVQPPKICNEAQAEPSRAEDDTIPNPYFYR